MLLFWALFSATFALSESTDKGKFVIFSDQLGPVKTRMHLFRIWIGVFVQQDVSEFTHKLLDWLEDAFQIKAEEDR